MAAAFFAAGFEVWDVNMRDVLKGDVTLDRFNGLAFVGGFSYADVLDSAKGWAGVIRFNSTLLHQFEHFRTRSDTFSFGACNGCQLMALLGWIPGDVVAPSVFDGKRKLLRIGEYGYENGEVKVRDIVRYDFASRTWRCPERFSQRAVMRMMKHDPDGCRTLREMGLVERC